MIATLFYYYEGMARMTLSEDVVRQPYTGGTKGNVIEKAGEVLVSGKQPHGLSWAAAINRCGYAGVSHMEYTIGDVPNVDLYGAVIPRHMVEQCLCTELGEEW